MKHLAIILLACIGILVMWGAGVEIRLDIAIIVCVLAGFVFGAFYLWNDGK